MDHAICIRSGDDHYQSTRCQRSSVLLVFVSTVGSDKSGIPGREEAGGLSRRQIE